MALTLTEQVKQRLPRPVRRSAGVSLVWAKRIAVWTDLLLSVRGVTARDRKILNRSARRGYATAGRDLDTWRAPVALEDLTVESKGVGRFQVRGESDDLYHVWKGRERAVTRLIETLRPGDVFVDGGANMGFYTVLASRLVGRTGRVYAVEMIPETADRLRAQIGENGLTNVTVVERALSAREGETVRASMPEGRWGMASIVRGDREPGAREIATTTLDVVLASEPKVRLIKLDLEGAEPLALAGATETLRKTEAVVFERAADAAEDAGLVATFEAAGLRVRALDSRNAVAEGAGA